MKTYIIGQLIRGCSQMGGRGILHDKRVMGVEQKTILHEVGEKGGIS